MSMTTNDERLPKPTVDTQACGAARRPSPIISHFPHARTNRPDGAVTMANVIDQIRAPSPETAALIARIRAEADKAKRRGLKQDLPAVTFGARFETVRRATAPYLPSRWTVVDVDGIDQSTAVVLRARALPGCKLAFLSPSARGVKFVVEVDPTPTAPDEHKAATIAVMEAYAAALGHEVDPSGKDVTRLCFLSHDPDLVVHEGGTPFSWCPPLQDVGNGGRRPLVTVADVVRQHGHMRKTGTTRWRGAPCPVCGGGEDDRFWAEEQGGTLLLGCNTCGHGAAFLRKALEALGCARAPGAVSDQRVDIGGLTKQGLILALEAVGVELRHNVRAHTTEIRNRGDGRFVRSDDRVIDDLRERIRRWCEWTPVKGEPKPASFGAEMWKRCSNAVLHDHEVDPFLERLQALPAWDGESRIDNVLALLWGRTDDVADDGLRRWASRVLFLAPVQRAFEPGCKLREIVVLAGTQDCGKSALLESMLWPEDAAEWFVSGLDLAADDKTLTEAVIGAVIVEAAEMVGVSRANLARMKAFITRQNDGHLRLAYRRDREPCPRRAVIVGTSNPDTAGILPNDPTGLTRFVVIDLPADRSLVGSVEDWLGERRDQLWAEALHHYRARERANLPDSLRTDAAAAVETHRRRDEFLEDRISSLAPQPMTLAEIAAGVGLAPDEGTATTVSPRDQKRLGAALTVARWSKRRARRNGKLVVLWEPPAA